MRFKKIAVLFFMAVAVTVPSFVLADKWGIDAAAPSSLIGRSSVSAARNIPDHRYSVIFCGRYFFSVDSIRRFQVDDCFWQ
jgi:hypothetical protein